MTTALQGGEGSVSRSGRSLPPGKNRYPLYRRLGGPQGRSGQVRKISPPPGFDPRTVQPVASRHDKDRRYFYVIQWRMSVTWNWLFITPVKPQVTNWNIQHCERQSRSFDMILSPLVSHHNNTIYISHIRYILLYDPADRISKASLTICALFLQFKTAYSAGCMPVAQYIPNSFRTLPSVT
jgi:hypothetical protein